MWCNSPESVSDTKTSMLSLVNEQWTNFMPDSPALPYFWSWILDCYNCFQILLCILSMCMSLWKYKIQILSLRFYNKCVPPFISVPFFDTNIRKHWLTNIKTSDTIRAFSPTILSFSWKRKLKLVHSYVENK